jgi:hypothetical protein
VANNKDKALHTKCPTENQKKYSRHLAHVRDHAATGNAKMYRRNFLGRKRKCPVIAQNEAMPFVKVQGLPVHFKGHEL